MLVYPLCPQEREFFPMNVDLHLVHVSLPTCLSASTFCHYFLICTRSLAQKLHLRGSFLTLFNRWKGVTVGRTVSGGSSGLLQTFTPFYWFSTEEFNWWVRYNIGGCVTLKPWRSNHRSPYLTQRHACWGHWLVSIFIHSLVFSLRGRVGRNQSPVMWPVWLWHTASWANSWG